MDESKSVTPRRRWTGAYADPASPIASTPQRRKAPATPVALSPMHNVEVPVGRRRGAGDVAVEGKATGIFSPSFHEGEEDDYVGAGAGSGEMRAVAAAVATYEYEEEDEVVDDEAFEEFNPYLFIKMLPPLSSISGLRPRVALPPKRPVDSRKLTLVLDLDETLVHAKTVPDPGADLSFPVEFGGNTYIVYVRKRPFLDRFLRLVSSTCEVIVFTASQRVYAEKLLNIIDPEGLIKYRLYRDSCLNLEGNYLKDLGVLGRDLRRTVLVDNSPHAFGYNLDNGVPIISYFDSVTDRELLKLQAFIAEIQVADDVRPIVRERFGIRRLVAAAGGR